MTEFLASFNASSMEMWGVALCFVALPLGVVLGWCWGSWKDRNVCEGEKR